MSIAELIAARKEALAAARIIADKSKTDEGATEEEFAEAEAHLAEASRIKGEIEAAEARRSRLLALGKSLDTEAAFDAQPRARLSASVDPEADSQPRIVGGEASLQFSHFGEYLFKVREAACSPSFTDPRLGPQAAAPGHRTDVDSLGGFLIPDQFAGGILQRMYSTGELLSRVKASGMVLPLQGNTIKLPRLDESSRADASRDGGILGYWLGETESFTDTKTKVGQMTLTLHKAGALAYVTDEMLEDYSASGAFLENLLTKALTFTVENSIVNGNGSNKPLGLLAANCGVSVAKITNQTAATIWGDNLTAMWARMWAPSRKTAVWLVNQSAEPFLFAATLEGRYGSAAGSADGIPLYYPAGSMLNQGQYGILMGRPVIPVEYTKAVGTVGDIILWDPASYILAEKAGAGIRKASSIHVQFLTEQTTFRASYRIDGQPTWDAALTPYDAGNTLSTIVTLAVRA